MYDSAPEAFRPFEQSMTFERKSSTRWIFQHINGAEWMVATDENRRISVSNSTMSKLFLLSDLLRRARGKMCDSGLFSLSETETKEWLRDCYGLAEVEQKSLILTHEVLERVLLYAEAPSMFTDFLRAKHEVIRFQRATGCISPDEKERVMKTLNYLRGRLIDASSGSKRQDSELGSIRDHILRIANVAVSSSDPRFSSLGPLLTSLRSRTENSLHADELTRYLDDGISPVIDNEEQDLLQDLCFIAKFRKALEERFDAKDENISERLNQLVTDAEQKEDLCLQAGFRRNAIKSLVNVGRALGIPALLKQCNAYYMWERECRRGRGAISTGLNTGPGSQLATNFHRGRDARAAQKMDFSRIEDAQRERREGYNLKGGAWSERSTLPDVEECLGGLLGRDSGRDCESESPRTGRSAMQGHHDQNDDDGVHAFEGRRTFEARETGMELLLDVLKSFNSGDSTASEQATSNVLEATRDHDSPSLDSQASRDVLTLKAIHQTAEMRNHDGKEPVWQCLTPPTSVVMARESDRSQRHSELPSISADDLTSACDEHDELADQTRNVHEPEDARRTAAPGLATHGDARRQCSIDSESERQHRGGAQARLEAQAQADWHLLIAGSSSNAANFEISRDHDDDDARMQPCRGRAGHGALSTTQPDRATADFKFKLPVEHWSGPARAAAGPGHASACEPEDGDGDCGEFCYPPRAGRPSGSLEVAGSGPGSESPQTTPNPTPQPPAAQRPAPHPSHPLSGSLPLSSPLALSTSIQVTESSRQFSSSPSPVPFPGPPSRPTPTPPPILSTSRIPRAKPPLPLRPQRPSSPAVSEAKDVEGSVERGGERKGANGAREDGVLTAREKEMVQERRAEGGQRKDVGKSRSKAEQERREQRGREREAEDARARREEQLRELQETSRQAVARSLSVKSRRNRPEEEPGAQQRRGAGADISPQTRQTRTLAVVRRAGQRAAEMKKKLAEQEEEAQAAKEAERWRKRDERLSRFREKMEVQDRISAASAAAAPRSKRAQPLAPEPAQHPRPSGHDSEQDALTKCHRFLKSMTLLEAAPALRSAATTHNRGVRRNDEQNRGQMPMHGRAPRRSNIHRIPEEVSESSSTDTAADCNSDESLVADEKVQEPGQQEEDEEEHRRDRQQRDGAREGAREQRTRSTASNGLGPPVLLQWESRAEGAARQPRKDVELEHGGSTTGSDSDREHPTRRGRRQQPEEDDEGVSVRRQEAGGCVGGGAWQSMQTGKREEQRGKMEEQREARERGKIEQQAAEVREQETGVKKSTRNLFGGWMAGGRDTSLDGESTGGEASPCERPRLGPPVMALPEPVLSVTEDGWIVRPAAGEMQR